LITLVLTTNSQQATEDNKTNLKPKPSGSSSPLITAYISAHIIGHKCTMQSTCDNFLYSAYHCSDVGYWRRGGAICSKFVVYEDPSPPIDKIWAMMFV